MCVSCSTAGVQALCVLIGRTPDPGAGPPAPRSPHWQHWEPKKADKTGTQEGDRMRPCGQSCIIKGKKKSLTVMFDEDLASEIRAHSNFAVKNGSVNHNL